MLGDRSCNSLSPTIGLDVRKEAIAVAFADAGKLSDVCEYGKIANTPAAVKALAAKSGRNGHALRFCYEGAHAAMAFSGS
jgi:hypothetical protein